MPQLNLHKYIIYSIGSIMVTFLLNNWPIMYEKSMVIMNPGSKIRMFSSWAMQGFNEF